MNRIKELRNQRNITQQKLADHLNVKRNAISRYENGERQPEYDVLIKLADFFGVTTDYILGRTDNLSPINNKSPEHDSELMKDYNELSDEDKKMLKEMARRLKEHGK